MGGTVLRKSSPATSSRPLPHGGATKKDKPIVRRVVTGREKRLVVAVLQVDCSIQARDVALLFGRWRKALTRRIGQGEPLDGEQYQRRFQDLQRVVPSEAQRRYVLFAGLPAIGISAQT